MPAAAAGELVLSAARRRLLRGRMSKLHWSLLILYLTAAAGYGGWQGRELWSGWGVWFLLLPLFTWETLKAIGEWRRKPYWVCVRFTLLKATLNIIMIGGFAVLLAWSSAWMTARWLEGPAVRAVVGALVAAVILILSAYHTGNLAPASREGKDSEAMGNSPDPGT